MDTKEDLSLQSLEKDFETKTKVEDDNTECEDCSQKFDLFEGDLIKIFTPENFDMMEIFNHKDNEIKEIEGKISVMEEKLDNLTISKCELNEYINLIRFRHQFYTDPTNIFLSKIRSDMLMGLNQMNSKFYSGRHLKTCHHRKK